MVINVLLKYCSALLTIKDKHVLKFQKYKSYWLQKTQQKNSSNCLNVRKCLVIKLVIFLGQIWLYVYFWKLSKREKSFKELGNDIALNLPAW